MYIALERKIAVCITEDTWLPRKLISFSKMQAIVFHI